MNGPAILLFKGRGFISTMIRWQTRSHYSHAALLLRDGSTIIEAWQGEGVRKKQIGDWNDVDTFHVDVSDQVWDAVIAFAEAQIGKPYDYVQVLRFVSRRKPVDDGKWFCSELAFEAFRWNGVKLLDRVPGSAVSPAMLSWSPLLKSSTVYSGTAPEH